MKHPLTRRVVTKILLAAPAAFTGGALACQSAAGPPPRRLSPAEQKDRQDLERSVAHLQKNVERLRLMEIPIGSEPAFRFTPLLAKK